MTVFERSSAFWVVSFFFKETDGVNFSFYLQVWPDPGVKWYVISMGKDETETKDARVIFMTNEDINTLLIN